MAKAQIVRGVLSKIRSATTARSVGARTFQNVDDVLAMPMDPVAARAAALSGNLRSGAARDFNLEELAQLGRYEDDIVGLRAVLAAQQRGGANKVRRRTFQKSGELRQRAGAYDNMTQGAVNRTNRLMDELDIETRALEDLMAQARNVSGMNSVGTTQIRFPNGNVIMMSPRQAAKRLDQEIARQQMRIDRLTGTLDKVQTKMTDRFTQASGTRKLADSLEQRAQAMPRTRTTKPERIAETRRQIDERQALINNLMSPTQAQAQAVVASTPAAGTGAAAAGSGAATGAKKQLGGGWKAGLGITAGIGGFMASQSFFGGLSEREENAQAGDRLQGMIAGAANQRLEMLRAMAAMQRIETGARQNLANLAMQQPHVLNEIMAGRQLAQGVVSIGGDRTAQMNRMAEVGAAMTTGQFNRMGSPDALGLLAQYMNQG